MRWWYVGLPLVLLAFLGGAVVAGSKAGGDEDGLPAGWEQRYGISTTENSDEDDPDHDRLTNLREYDLHTNPREGDTDGDGYSDWIEDGKETDPTDPRSGPGFPTPASTGVPPGWTPAETRTSDIEVTKPGAVVSDVLLQNADIVVEAPNVTIRRVKLQGGVINNAPSSDCGTGLVIEQSTIEPAPGQDWGDDTEGVISYGGYTADGVKIWHRSEGFRASECGPVTIRNSFALVTPPRPCGDWHGDGLQGYGAGPITVHNVTLDLDMTDCDGTAPFFVPSDQGNTSVDVDRLLVKGGGYPFRLGVPGTVSGLKVAADSWVFGPVDVRCSGLSRWDAEIVALSPEYQITRHLRSQRCEGTGV